MSNSVQRYLASLYQQAPDLLDIGLLACTITPTRNIIVHWASSSFEKLTGCTSETCAGRPLTDFIDLSEPDSLTSYILEAIADCNANKAKVNIKINKYGTAQGWLRSFPIDDPDGNPGALIALDLGAADLIDRRRGNFYAVGYEDFQPNVDNLHVVDERFMRFAIRASGIGLWEWHVPSNNVQYSPEWFTMLGYEPNEFPSGFDTWRTLTHSDDTVDILEKADRAFKGYTDGYVGRFRMLCKDGSWKWIKATGEVLERDAEGKALLIMGIHADQSDEVAQEEQLRTALAEAQAGQKAKSQFLAVMSHEIRTPLNGILGMLDQLLDSDLNADQQSKATLARQSATSLLTILNDTLDFSKLESGSIELENVDFDPVQTVTEALATFEPIAEEKGLDLRQSAISDMDQWLCGDVMKIRQILLNLVGNAVKFTDRGHVHVSVSQHQSSDQLWLRLSVSDTGVGITAESQARLFESFTQADNSISRQYGGTGLGLAISQGFATAMKGRITVNSAVGQGSTFQLDVPVARTQRSKLPTGKKTGIPHKKAAKPIVPFLAGKKILAAEDNPINTLVLKGYLEPLNLDVRYVENGREAVDAASQEPFDLILMDIHMPEMDGVTATRAIRRGEDVNRNTPVIAVTADAIAGDREKFINAGMDDYVPKPIDCDLFYKVLGQYLEKSPERADEHMPPRVQYQMSTASAGLETPASPPKPDNKNKALKGLLSALDTL